METRTRTVRVARRRSAPGTPRTRPRTPPSPPRARTRPRARGRPWDRAWFASASLAGRSRRRRPKVVKRELRRVRGSRPLGVLADFFTVPAASSQPFSRPSKASKRTSERIFPPFRTYRTGLNETPRGRGMSSMCGMLNTSHTPSEASRISPTHIRRRASTPPSSSPPRPPRGDPCRSAPAVATCASHVSSASAIVSGSGCWLLAAAIGDARGGARRDEPTRAGRAARLAPSGGRRGAGPAPSAETRRAECIDASAIESAPRGGTRASGATSRSRRASRLRREVLTRAGRRRQSRPTAECFVVRFCSTLLRDEFPFREPGFPPAERNRVRP